jgi:hypothetical protein
MPVRARFGLFLAALWWGSLTGLGFVVVPMLFMHMGSPAAAGSMAAKLFTAQTWLSTGCAMLLLMVFNKRDDAVLASHVSTAMKFVVAGLLLTLLVEFGVAPRILNARALGGDLRFWHGLGSAMYLGQWLCAAVTLWRLASRSGAEAGGLR